MAFLTSSAFPSSSPALYSSSPSPSPLKSPYNSPLGARPSSLSFASSIPLIKLSTPPRLPNPPTPLDRKAFIVQAAWTRRSRGELAKRPNRKSWKQRTDMYMRPFLLNVFFSKRFIHAKVVHRGTSKVISVASTNAKDLRNTLPSLIDNDACRTIGQLIAERSKEADVFAMSFEPKKNERIEVQHAALKIPQNRRKPTPIIGSRVRLVSPICVNIPITLFSY
ncbi:uncharacterized protein LOC109715653 [Ananas comosus]|uniref:Uncharacterized protein LOC109715653 n=1 Tax=Ananas comosus TaxID=4615 RepID=A0A6P5FL33_ANACO|nr:uncharacterized protein LOC109715653 [Ananas comosus]